LPRQNACQDVCRKHGIKCASTIPHKRVHFHYPDPTVNVKEIPIHLRNPCFWDTGAPKEELKVYVFC